MSKQKVVEGKTLTVRLVIPPEKLVYEMLRDRYLSVWMKDGTLSKNDYVRASKECQKLQNISQKKKNSEKREHTSCPKEEDDVKNLPDFSETKKERQRRLSSAHNSRDASATEKLHKSETLVSELLQKTYRLEDELVAAYEDLNEKTRQVSSLAEELENSRDEIHTLRMRVSKLAGDKLRDNNPNITDLSDQNRPTELGKRYSEIYDNMWSDAFETLPGKDENVKVDILFTVIEDAFKFCRERLVYQTSNIRSIILSESSESNELEDGDSRSSSPVAAGEMAPCNKTTRTGNLHNLLKDIRRQFAANTAKNLANEYASFELNRVLKGYGLKIDGALKKYAEECLEICWLMTVCDPPMDISTREVDEPFNMDIYKPYTRSTKAMKNARVELYVWPALYLNFRGPLVAKGVAQPIDVKSKRK